VFSGGQHVDQPCGLEDEAKISAAPGQSGAVIGGGEINVIMKNLALRRPYSRGKDRQQGRFARSAGTGNAAETPSVELPADWRQHTGSSLARAHPVANLADG
jgi:hypothetical protein